MTSDVHGKRHRTESRQAAGVVRDDAESRQSVAVARARGDLESLRRCARAEVLRHALHATAAQPLRPEPAVPSVLDFEGSTPANIIGVDLALQIIGVGKAISPRGSVGVRVGRGLGDRSSPFPGRR